MRLLHDRAQLVERELRLEGSRPWRHVAARGHDLDDVDPARRPFPYRLPQRLDSLRLAHPGSSTASGPKPRPDRPPGSMSRRRRRGVMTGPSTSTSASLWKTSPSNMLPHRRMTMAAFRPAPISQCHPGPRPKAMASRRSLGIRRMHTRSHREAGTASLIAGVFWGAHPEQDRIDSQAASWERRG